MKKVTAFFTRKFILTVLIVLSTTTFSVLNAQNGDIKGKVTDANTGEPLIGAAVMVMGTSTGAATDFDGNFTLANIKAGNYTLRVSFISYRTDSVRNVMVETGKETALSIRLLSADISLKEVEIVAKANRESESVLLLEQKKSLLATQAVGAREMSRKGVSDAEAAVTKVSGISKQEGVKNVFVRGLGDRYNATSLNGFPIPSEDPEYKNISLDFFGTDIIQNVGVNKVFNGSGIADVAGAVIDISSKELVGERALGMDVSAGVNTQTFNKKFLKQDGVNYFGFANNQRPSDNLKVYNFANSLDPSVSNFQLNHGYGASGGKKFFIGENRNPLTFFVVASHSVSYSYTKEIVRNTTTMGDVYLDMSGDKYSQNINQLELANLSYDLNSKHHLAYNFMMVHANNQYVGEFQGKNSEKYQQAADYNYNGYMRRQQNNDNLLFVNQLNTDWQLSEKMKLNVGVAYNAVQGLEPDRRINHLAQSSTAGDYSLVASNNQKRFFSTLKENDLNGKAGVTLKLPDNFGSKVSTLQIGYKGRVVLDNFKSVDNDMNALSGNVKLTDLKLDALYNQSNLDANKFKLEDRNEDKYTVNKYIQGGYAEGTYQLSSKITANVALKYDYAYILVNYNVNKGGTVGSTDINKGFFLPSLNVKYDLNDKNSLRLGLSKTYTLPQSKEISPYVYVSLGFKSQGNKDLKPSDNYNLDLKWDYYLSPSELISLTGFYKYIVSPISRTEEGGSGGYLSYKNISKSATVAGAELEVRKNLFAVSANNSANKLTLGLNASYTYTDLVVDVLNTSLRHTPLEGAAPFIGNFDISYNFQKNKRDFTASVVLNYFSDRIFTIGTVGYRDIIEKGVPTLDFVASTKVNKQLSLKLKATNILNPAYQLSRKGIDENSPSVILSDYKKGMNISVGVSYEL